VRHHEEQYFTALEPLSAREALEAFIFANAGCGESDFMSAQSFMGRLALNWSPCARKD